MASYALVAHMPWTVLLAEEFDPEFEELPADIQDELLSRLKLLEQFAPNLGRPNVDTLEGSSFANMKELRFRLDGLGGLLLPSILNDKPSSWWAATKKGKAKIGSIVS
jgi:hypothetical protein